MRYRNILLLGTGLCLSQCYSPRQEHRNTATVDTALSEKCGNAKVEAEEECDPAAEGWQDSCDADCHRTSYVSCEVASDCAELNANCAAYQAQPGRLFCASFCERDADCPVLPAFEARCNFAWCAVSCRDGACPHGMSCAPGQTLLDHDGQQLGQLDVCVIDPQ